MSFGAVGKVKEGECEEDAVRPKNLSDEFMIWPSGAEDIRASKEMQPSDKWVKGPLVKVEFSQEESESSTDEVEENEAEQENDMQRIRPNDNAVYFVTDESVIPELPEKNKMYTKDNEKTSDSRHSISCQDFSPTQSNEQEHSTLFCESRCSATHRDFSPTPSGERDRSPHLNDSGRTASHSQSVSQRRTCRRDCVPVPSSEMEDRLVQCKLTRPSSCEYYSPISSSEWEHCPCHSTSRRHSSRRDYSPIPSSERERIAVYSESRRRSYRREYSPILSCEREHNRVHSKSWRPTSRRDYSPIPSSEQEHSHVHTRSRRPSSRRDYSPIPYSEREYSPLRRDSRRPNSHRHLSSPAIERNLAESQYATFRRDLSSIASSGRTCSCYESQRIVSHGVCMDKDRPIARKGPPHSTSQSTESESAVFPLSEKSFQEKVLFLLADIRQQLSELRKRVHVLEDEDVYLEPCSSLEELNGLDNLANSEEYRVQMIAKLARVGGSSVRDNVQRVMERLMKNEVMANMNLKGKGKKHAFVELKLYRVVIESVMKSQEATEEEIIKAIANVLKYAPDRRGGGGRKAYETNE